MKNRFENYAWANLKNFGITESEIKFLIVWYVYCICYESYMSHRSIPKRWKVAKFHGEFIGDKLKLFRYRYHHFKVGLRFLTFDFWLIITTWPHVGGPSFSILRVDWPEISEENLKNNFPRFSEISVLSRFGANVDQTYSISNLEICPSDLWQLLKIIPNNSG